MREKDILMKLVMPKYSITYNRLGINIGKHPVIFFKNYQDNEYYYVSARSASDFDNKKRFKYNYEVEITNSKMLNNKVSYIDTTQIFHINKQDLYKVFDKDSVIFLNTNYFDINDIKSIYNKIYQNLTKNPPYVSLSYININKNKIHTQTKYSHKEFLWRNYSELQIKPDGYKYLNSAKWQINKILNNNNYPDTILELDDLAGGIYTTYTEIIQKHHLFEKFKSFLKKDYPQFLEDKKLDFNKYSPRQLEQIYLGLQASVDVDKYLDSKWEYDQMQQIRIGLQAKIDIKDYYDNNLDGLKMQQIRECIFNELDIKNKYKNYWADSENDSNYDINKADINVKDIFNENFDDKINIVFNDILNPNISSLNEDAKETKNEINVKIVKNIDKESKSDNDENSDVDNKQVNDLVIEEDSGIVM
ncbi:Mbov_0400 family ICE element protein [Mycoplasma sp. 5912]